MSLKLPRPAHTFFEVFGGVFVESALTTPDPIGKILLAIIVWGRSRKQLQTIEEVRCACC